MLMIILSHKIWTKLLLKRKGQMILTTFAILNFPANLTTQSLERLRVHRIFKVSRIEFHHTALELTLLIIHKALNHNKM